MKVLVLFRNVEASMNAVVCMSTTLTNPNRDNTDGRARLDCGREVSETTVHREKQKQVHTTRAGRTRHSESGIARRCVIFIFTAPLSTLVVVVVFAAAVVVRP
jgi:hypothetical protein